MPPIDGDYDSDGEGEGEGGGGGPAAGKVYLFGGQDPVKGAIFDDMLVRMQRGDTAAGAGCGP